MIAPLLLGSREHLFLSLLSPVPNSLGQGLSWPWKVTGSLLVKVAMAGDQSCGSSSHEVPI